MRYPTTRWSSILGARADAEQRRILLGELLTEYWRPLYLFCRRQGLDTEAAADAVQDFIAAMLERDVLQRVHPDRGRLRTYLRVCLRNHLAHRWERQNSQRRGGRLDRTSLEAAEAELSTAPHDPDEAYDRAWAGKLLSRCLDTLEAEYKHGQRAGPSALLRALFGLQAAGSYEEIALAHDMSLSQLKSFAHRARVRYRQLVLAEVADTVVGGPMITDEALELMDLMR
ncbi:hypothetical protein DB30_04271 [Enhygromyxa salina]|uniref:RNA polymerase sigma factor n=1 Tax=Enhygromyxa salina TaxID=215803 RepID=A0A0C2D9I5_9BACT|nr:hypothetical protein DB30_04271 [Enhygromyxa salina]